MSSEEIKEYMKLLWQLKLAFKEDNDDLSEDTS